MDVRWWILFLASVVGSRALSFTSFSNVSSVSLEDRWVHQKLDHFDVRNNRTWRMRFWERSEFFQPGGPILIALGGEWSLDDVNLIGDGILLTDMARDLKGALFYPEHRYYGRSLPVPNASTENLRYLTIDQVLADVAAFIDHVRATRPEFGTSKVGILGPSYSGTVAVWFAQKYPQYVDATWASCAPVYQEVSSYVYNEAVGEGYRLVGGDDCYDAIENSFRELEKMIAEGESERISSELRLCKPLDVSNSLDVQSLFFMLREHVSQVEQNSADSIQDTCNAFLDPGFESPFEAFASWIRLFFAPDCFFYAYEEQLLAYIRKTDWEELGSSIMRQWSYQLCTGHGGFPTTESKKQPFGYNTVPTDYFVSICRDVFGPQFTRESLEAATRRLNLLYGGLRPQVTKILYTHGQLDPWRPRGVQETDVPDAHVKVVPLVSHVQDIYSIGTSDPRELRETKELAISLFRKWLRA